MIRLTQTTDVWTVEVTGLRGETVEYGSGYGDLFSFSVTGQHKVAVLGRGRPEPETDEALRDGIAKLNAENVPLYRLESLRGLTDGEARREAEGDSVAREREWWIRRAQREAEAAAREMAEAVAKERARCLGWVECYLGGLISWYNWTDVRDAVRDGRSEAPK